MDRLKKIWTDAERSAPVQDTHILRLCASLDADDRLRALILLRIKLLEDAAPEWIFDKARSMIRDSDNDCRWQAMIVVGEFIAERPAEIWEIVQQYGVSEDDDMRTAVATVLLEHLIDYDPKYRPLAEEAAKRSMQFARTLSMCWTKERPL